MLANAFMKIMRQVSDIFIPFKKMFFTFSLFQKKNIVRNCLFQDKAKTILERKKKAKQMGSKFLS